MAEKLPGVRHVVAVASGKGGVGKTTVSVNLALALHQLGARSGLLDADILGPSVPVMLGIPRGEPPPQEEGLLLPPERYGVKAISMGMLTGDDAPAVFRGPMVSKYLQAFVAQVKWGKLDCLVLDLPPGTGDVQLTLAQTVPLSGAIIVTTPQDVSLAIARRGLRMFERVKVPILGVIENMSGFVCPHCGEATDIFRRGGGAKMSAELDVPFLGMIPLDADVVTGGDEGVPVVVGKPDSPVAQAYRKIARELMRVLEGEEATALGGFEWRWEDDRGAPGWHEEAARTDGSPTVPLGLRKRDPRTLSVLWQDGRRDDFDVRDLRLACPCAACVEETTGRRTLDPATVRGDVSPRSVASVGSYAIAFDWNDGHSTGIYSFDLLRGLGEAARAPAGYEV